ncbi:MAG: cytochrome c biogenesis CcdA family protein [Egibacteraceae bacterium]
MDGSIFLGGSVIAAVVAGMIALFAPCCISVMLPAFFASSFQNQRILTAMTFVFAAGIATVILPIALGAAALRQLLLTEHTAIYLAGGTAMLALAAYTLLGGRMSLPMPGRRAGASRGPLGVYTLGLFSGVASSCCAPVLAGVIALSGLSSSFAVALGLGGGYVFGMVAPLFAIALLWERRDWASSRLFRPCSYTWRIGPLRRTVSGTSLASGLLLAVMGGATVAIAFQGEAMPAANDWQAQAAVWLQRVGAAITGALSWLPGWVGGLLVAVLVAALAYRAVSQLTPDPLATERERPTADRGQLEEPHDQHA